MNIRPKWSLLLLALTIPWLLGAFTTRPQEEALPQDKPASKEEPAEDEVRGIAWRTDRAAAIQEAHQLGKPVLWYYRCDP